MVVSKVAEGKGNFGYDALKDEYTDLVKAGIIDPTKVTRSALQNAASVSTLLLTSDALIADMPKDEEARGRRRPRRVRRHVLIDGREASPILSQPDRRALRGRRPGFFVGRNQNPSTSAAFRLLNRCMQARIRGGGDIFAED